MKPTAAAAQDDSVTANIIGCAFKVYNQLGFGFLKATNQMVGLLINFGPDGVEVKRKYRDYVRQDQHD